MKRFLRRLSEYVQLGGMRVLVPLIKTAIVGVGPLAELRRSDSAHSLFIRVRTSDVRCYQQIFVAREYEYGVAREPEVIVDAGANIGLASVFFAIKHPHAKIIAIEPEASNFELLRRNCMPYSQITPVCAALWDDDVDVRLVDPGNGKWGFMAESSENATQTCQMVRGMTMRSLMAQEQLDCIDILKVDIEGSEREVFGGRPDWVDRIGALIIETHDWLRPGCGESVMESTRDFDDRWQQGENWFFARDGSCIFR